MEDFIADVRKMAEQGDAEAQFKFGFMCLKGLGVPKDEEAAALWLGKSAEQGNTGAAFQLQLLLESTKA